MPDQKRDIVLRWYNEVWNNSNESAIDEMLHPEVEAFGLGPESMIGTENFKLFYRAFNDAYSDIHVTVDKTLVDGDYVTALCSITATHKETGKLVNFTGVTITLLEKGQIKRAWNHFDFMTLNLQTGKITQEQLL